LNIDGSQGIGGGGLFHLRTLRVGRISHLLKRIVVILHLFIYRYRIRPPLLQSRHTIPCVSGQSSTLIYIIFDAYATIDPNMHNHTYTHMHWIHLQNNWYEYVCNHTYIYTLFIGCIGKTINTNVCNQMYTHIHWMHICKTIDTNMCNQMYTHIHWMHICKTIDTNLCNHTYTHMHWMHICKTIDTMCAIIRINMHWMRMQQSIQTCENHIYTRIHWMRMQQSIYVYTYALNKYAIIHMNVDVIREREKAQVFVTLWILQKKDFHHNSHVLMNKFLIRFGHSGSLSLSLSL
jgi:hypothetical protein